MCVGFWDKTTRFEKGKLSVYAWLLQGGFRDERNKVEQQGNSNNNQNVINYIGD